MKSVVSEFRINSFSQRILNRYIGFHPVIIKPQICYDIEYLIHNLHNYYENHTRAREHIRNIICISFRLAHFQNYHKRIRLTHKTG